MNPTQKLETLFGGRAVSVLHEDGSRTEIKVRQLRLADYEKAFVLMEDEFAFTAFCCQQSSAWITTLQPESYELLQAAAWEVNEKGFFAYAARRVAKAQAEQDRQMAQLARMSPEAIRVAAELGQSISPTASPRPR